MRVSIKIVFAVFVLSVIISGCAAEAPAPAVQDEQPEIQSNMEKESEKEVAYKRITPDEAKTKMTQDAVILDVRMSDEFNAGHIPNAVLLPDIELADKAADILPDKDQTILVYCRSGRRSQAAAMELINMGYTDVYDFGGIIDWNGEIEK